MLLFWTKYSSQIRNNLFSCFLYVQGFSLEWCMKPDIGLPKPDLVMFLQLNPNMAANRGEYGIERYETSAFQRTVQKRFEELMQDASVNWKVVYFVL